MSDKKRWVYRSGWDFTLSIKPAQKKHVSDKFGNNQVFTEKGVRVKFVGGFLVVDESLSKNLNLPMETIVKWVEMQPQFNGHYYLIESPGMAVNEKEKEKIEVSLALKTKKAPLVQGPRAVGGKQ